jgi:hypothetical protein
MNNKFDVADPLSIYRLSPSNPPQIIQGLNPAHPKFNSGSFLGGRLRLGREGVR